MSTVKILGREGGNHILMVGKGNGGGGGGESKSTPEINN